MCFTVPEMKNVLGDFCVLTSEGEVRTFKGLTTASRILFSINGKKESVYYENVGLGPDTNTLSLNVDVYIHIEYGNVTNERILECIRTLMDKGWLDLSGVRVIRDLSEISEHEEEEYLYLADAIWEGTLWE